ncbi:MAG: flagellar biosynthesis protein FlhF [Sarcina sp.]
MIIKKYLVSNMNEAMTRIRLELGKEAVIISQRNVRQKGMLGFFSKKLIEVTAAKDNNVTDLKKKEYESFNHLEAIKAVMEKEIVSRDNETKYEDVTNIKENNNNEILYNEVQEMKKMLSGILTPSCENELAKLLLEEDVASEIIKDLVKDITDIDQIKAMLKNLIKIDSSPIQGKTVLVGPTGVGKTTTIAKLAGKLSLIENKNVGLITIDTYRIGAVEQLKTYAQIMGIPFEVVMNIDEMDKALEKMKDCDVILVDTTGRSSKNIMQISELRVFIEKVKADNISLVVSSTTKNKDLKLIIDSYKQLGYKDIIITKIDETDSKGTILNIAYISDKPIRFLTTGQNVPNDIKECSKDEVIESILREALVC